MDLKTVDHQDEELKSRVRAHWEQEVCGSRYGTEYAADRRKFFDEIERTRYEQDYMLKGFARFPEAKGKKVLEVGLGTGTDFIQWARNGADATGRDLTQASVDLVTERLALEGLKANVARGDAENLEFPDNTFDLFYSWGVLMATPDTPRAIGEAYRVLKPGGTMRIMLYQYRSIAVFLVWLVHGPLKGKFVGPRRAAYDNVESPGQKFYTPKEARAMVGKFFREPITIKKYLGSGDLLSHRLSKKYDKPIWRFLVAIYPTWFVRHVLGHAFGSVMTIEATK